MNIQHSREEQVDQNIKSKSTTIEKQFNFGNIRCTYINTHTIKVDDSQKTSELIVSNFLSKQVGNKLSKVTKIQLGDKIFLIDDVYILDDRNVKEAETGSSERDNMDPSSKNNQQNQNKYSMREDEQFMDHKRKKFLFNRNKQKGESQSKEKNQYQKRDTKNLVKNFCKAFIRYLTKQNSPFLKELQQIIQDNGKYNNILIEKIVKNIQFSPLFESFLIQEATQWIENSKINNKESHKQGIRVYLKLINQFRKEKSFKKNSQKQIINYCNKSYNNKEKGSSQNKSSNSKDSFDIFKSSSS